MSRTRRARKTTVNGTHERCEAVKILAAAWPRDGRHGVANALAGGLLRAGWDADAVEQFVRDVAEAAEDDRVADRVADARSTAKRLADGEKKITGWPALGKLLSDDVVRRVRVTLGMVCTVEALASAKNLPADFLRSLGVEDMPLGGVGIAYKDMAGRVAATKERPGISAHPSYWPEATPPMAYGEDRLREAVAAGFLIVAEGESDCWACWHGGFAALGLPGANTAAATLREDHVRGIGTIYVVQETDAAGEEFVKEVTGRVVLFGHGTTVRRLKMPSGLKDPAALYVDDPAGFWARMEQALQDAEEIPLDSTSASSASPPPGEPPWPDPPDDEAFHGPAGDVVNIIDPHTEAARVAILVQTLVGFGSIIGRSAHFRAEADTHYLNEFVVLIGRTSKGRKGSSWGHVRKLLADVDSVWADGRVLGGLSSGEGLIWAVRDPVMKRERIKEEGEVRYEEIEADPGVEDKRLLIYEPEFANVLRQTERQGNTLSAILRQAWDGGDLRTLTKNSPAHVTGAYISVIGHVTNDELRRSLTTTEAANGYGNRHLWICVERSKSLPEGGCLPDGALAEVTGRFVAAAEHARGLRGPLCRDEEARAVWREVYQELSDGLPGMTGSMLARAEAHVMRLACLYAVLDLAEEIRAEHLMAALALWEYCERSVRYVFGDALGDPLADEILRMLRARREQGMTRGQILDAFGRNQSSTRIGQALGLLLTNRLVRAQTEATGGRPAERWFAVR